MIEDPDIFVRISNIAEKQGAICIFSHSFDFVFRIDYFFLKKYLEDKK